MTTYNTGNPVGSTDARDLYDNSQALDQLVNGSGTYANRLGVQRRTLAKLDADFDAQLADAEADLNVYRADAAASAGEALGYLQTIRATSYGALANDPATDPVGNPCTAGDEYFNTTLRQMRVYDGSLWMAQTTPSDASAVVFQQSGDGARASTVKSRLDESAISAFGCMTPEQIADVKSASPTMDVTVALNTAAAVARTMGKSLKLPEVKSHYPISGTVDFSGIRFIDGRGALLQGAFSGSPAAIIGDGTVDGQIWLEVKNSADKSIVDGTFGIKVLGMSGMRCYVGARGFDDGLHFDGVSATRAWVSNEFHILKLYNNGSQVHFNLANSSYVVANQFRGGVYYLGTNQLKAGRGTIKATLAGSALLSEILFDAPQIGIDGGSRAEDHGLFVYGTCATSSTINTISFKNARLELYSSSAFVPYYINIPTTTSGTIAVDVDALSMPYAGCQLNLGESKQHNVKLNYRSINGVSQSPRTHSNIRPTFPYQSNNRVYVPERILYDSNYLTPAPYITNAVGYNGPNRAIGDGKFISQSTAVAIGTKWKKGYSDRPVFLKLSDESTIVVICYDAAGNVLSGTTPWYCVTRGVRSIASGGVTVYQGSTDWVFIHPAVDSFFIGWAAWSAPGYFSDFQFEVLMGPRLTRIRDDETGPNMVSASSSIQSYMQVGAAMDAATAAFRNELSIKTTATVAAASGATTITVGDATSVNTSCQIGIELDTVIFGSERRYQHCSITAVAGNVITISPALTADVSAGRRVFINKWIAR